MAFSPPEYCRLFAQKKAYQGGVTGTPGPPPPPSYAPDGVNLCRRNAASIIALESAEWFDLQHNFLFRTEGQSTPSLLEYEVKQRNLHDNGRNTIKGGSREAKGQKSTGGGRTGYGKWEIVTPLSPLTSFGIRTIRPPDN